MDAPLSEQGVVCYTLKVSTNTLNYYQAYLFNIPGIKIKITRRGEEFILHIQSIYKLIVITNENMFENIISSIPTLHNYPRLAKLYPTLKPHVQYWILDDILGSNMKLLYLSILVRKCDIDVEPKTLVLKNTSEVVAEFNNPAKYSLQNSIKNKYMFDLKNLVVKFGSYYFYIILSDKCTNINYDIHLGINLLSTQDNTL